MTELHPQANEPTAEEKEAMQARMNAYIFPNTPYTAEEKAAFEKAVLFQIQNERMQKEALGGQTLPDGLKEFTIGHFQGAFETGISSALSRKTICGAAYGELLRAGLLYRGVERRRPYPCH